MTTKYSKAIKVQEPLDGAARAGVGLVGGTPTNRKIAEIGKSETFHYLKLPSLPSEDLEEREREK